MTTETAELAATETVEGEAAQPPAVPDKPVEAPALADRSRGIQLTTIEDYYRFAQYIAKARLAPKGMETPEACMVALQMGAEVGLAPMASIQNIAVINGRPSIWGDAMLGLLKASPLWDESAFDETQYQDEKRGIVARCVMRRKGGEPKMTEFTQRMAEKAKLWTKDGPWQNYPVRMLQMRARAWRARDSFPDVLKGLSVAEEIIDVEFEAVSEQPPLEQPRAIDAPVPADPDPAGDPGEPAGEAKPATNGSVKLVRMKAKFPSRCGSCDGDIAAGDPIVYDKAAKTAYHNECYSMGDE